ncbi:pilus assembly FimT family protein [Sulfurospirillum barnesii]|uniref:pilus assembly FimT family protein n=1 Tax=Sulfurospirillum barnesii TaxID=44674 RepID=UPI000317B88F|nr:type II secretion system protein [Sulfurospirillum barnesii]
MKKAFTMIELVFVIVIVGILSYMVASSFVRNPLREAADQVVSHIRYTQHLAMQDNHFNSNDANWFQGRWQIRFFQNLSFTNVLPPIKNYDNEWAYSIYSDRPNYTHLPNLTELARNPLNQNQYLSGGYNNTLHVEDEQSMKEMRLKTQFGIQTITFAGGCRGGITHIQFDEIGRPYNSYITNNNPAGEINVGFPRLIINQCRITLSDGTLNIVIAIEPETGYTHIL